MDRHKTLQRQAARHLGDLADDPRIQAFLDAVNESYLHHERDRELLERSMELSAGELTEKNELLRQRNEALDTFVHRVSHDLKAPVNNMLAMTNMLRDLLGNREQHPMTERVMTNIETACRTLGLRIKDLLEMTRIERNLNNQSERIALAPFLDTILENIQDKVQATQAKVEYDFDEFPEIFYARENLNSVLGNLVENAIKYRDPARTPHVRIKARPQGGYCEVVIADNGLGMDLERTGDKLFGMINRLHSHVEGSGLGLYLVKKIVETKGGSIQVSSQVGVGTTFTLLLHNDRP